LSLTLPELKCHPLVWCGALAGYLNEFDEPENLHFLSVIAHFKHTILRLILFM